MITALHRLTRSQKEIVELATAPIVRGVELNVVKIEAGHAGVTYAARHAVRETASPAGVAPRSVLVMGTSNWDAQMCLVKIAGKDCYGSGHLDIMERCFRRLAGQDKRSLCVLLDRAGRMGPADQEDFAGRAEWCANHNGIAIRVIFLIQKTKIWDPLRQDHVRDWNLSAPLCRSAREHVFRADGLEEILGTEQAAPAPLRAVKTA